MLLNFAVMWVVSLLTPPPPEEVRRMVESIRYPRDRGAGETFNPLNEATAV
jgi:cation/acetate symporter